jgi:ADP-heptose:LPS heptosyltransferase
LAGSGNTLIGLPWAAEFAARYARYIDRFIEFPGYPGLPEREPLLARIPEFLTAMQREKFDLALQLHGSGTIVNSLLALFGARQTAGFFPPGYFCPDRATFIPWPDQGLEIHRLLSLVDFLGLPIVGDHLELPLDESDRAALDQIFPHPKEGQPYVVFHPGASTPARRWAADNFAAVADRLAEDDFQIVVTGVVSEQAVVNQMIGAMESPAIDLCGRTELGTLGALVSRADLVVCNDTGISHVAAAVKTPSVVISTATIPLAGRRSIVTGIAFYATAQAFS